MRLFAFDDPAHAEGAALLPWYLNGTLEGHENGRVQAHLAECVACQRELRAQRTLQEVLQRDEGEASSDGSLVRLHARLDATGQRRSRVWPRTRQRWGGLLVWSRAAFAAVCVVLAALVAVLVSERASVPQLYHTLSTSMARGDTADRVVVVFDADVREREIRRILSRVDGRIVDGPNDVGAYVLAVPSGQQVTALAFLRVQSSVEFAEPAGAAAERR